MSTEKSVEVAVVDAEHVGLDVERHLELALVVHLDERVEVERARLAQQVEQVVGLERGDDQQDRVGARGRRLVELVRVDDEVLAQHRQVGHRARGAQVVERAAEVERLGEDRQRRRRRRARTRARSPRPSSPRGSCPPTASGACARRSARCPGRSSASENGRRSGRSATAASSRDERHRLAAPPDLVARVLDDPLEHAHAGASSRVISTSRSRLAAARPSSIAASAARTPSSSVSACPAT